jgi:hypothetical protein
MVDIFPSERVGEPKGQFAVVILAETDEDAQKGKAMIEKIVEDQAGQDRNSSSGAGAGNRDSTKRISVPIKHHRRLIGPKGSGISEIREHVGMQINVQFPRYEDNSSEIEIRGSAAAVEKCIKVITDMVTSWDSSAVVSVVTDHHLSAPVAERAGARTPDSFKASSDSGAPEGPPGWSGQRTSAKARNAPPPAASTVGETVEYFSAPAPSSTSTKQDDEWKVIGKKAAAKAPEPAAAPKPGQAVVEKGTVPGASADGTAKKKKNKGKKPADISAIVASSAAPEPSPTLEYSPVGQWAESSQDPIVVNGDGASEPSAAAPASSAPAPAPAAKAPVDEWQPVNTVKKFKAKKVEEEEKKKAAAPAVVPAVAGTAQRNAYAMLEDQAPSSGSSKKKSKK